MKINNRYAEFQRNLEVNSIRATDDRSYERFERLRANDITQPIYIEYLSGLEESYTPEDNS